MSIESELQSCKDEIESLRSELIQREAQMYAIQQNLTTVFSQGSTTSAMLFKAINRLLNDLTDFNDKLAEAVQKVIIETNQKQLTDEQMKEMSDLLRKQEKKNPL